MDRGKTEKMDKETDAPAADAKGKEGAKKCAEKVEIAITTASPIDCMKRNRDLDRPGAGLDIHAGDLGDVVGRWASSFRRAYERLHRAQTALIPVIAAGPHTRSG